MLSHNTSTKYYICATRDMYKQHADSGTQCQTSTANVCTGVEVTKVTRHVYQF